ncbi:flippase-like domain-containing protein [candidate division KSB1 bacterium]|nr:flippase-like domain-containing protein [candidate division KSB1 bacterium]
MKQILKRKLIYFVKVTLGLTLVTWILFLVDHEIFLEYFAQLTFGTILLIGFLSLLSLYIQYLRWKYLLNCNSDHFAKEDVIPSFLAGFTFRLMLPGGHAEISKIFLLPGKKKGKVAAFGLEKLVLTFIKLFLILIVLPLTFPQLTPYCVALLIVLMITILLIPKLRILKRFQEKETNYYTMLSFTLVFSLITFALMAGQYYILLNKVNAISLWPTAHTSIYLWGSGMIPISISGLGVREGLAVFFFNSYGINAAQAVATSLFLFALGSIIPALAGVYFISKKKEHFKELKDVVSSTRDLIKASRFRKQIMVSTHKISDQIATNHTD